MLKAAAAGRLTTSASSHVSNQTLAGINHIALATAKMLLAENSTRLASDAATDAHEREHHAHIAKIASR